MAEKEILQWSALEYEEKERGNDWFWALGIIVIASSVASILFGNYFFAVFLVLCGIVLWLFAVKEPDMVSYELNSKGLKIRYRLYPYDKIKFFWVQNRTYTEKEELPATLFIMSERIFMPVISMPVEDYMAADVRAMMLAHNVPEQEMKEHMSHKIMGSLGF